MFRKVVAAVLAAGAATRFDGPKQLAKFDGKALIDIALDSVINANIDEICVVLGSRFDEIKAHLDARQSALGHVKRSTVLHILNNSEWKDGISTSIRTATDFAARQQATHLILLTCDQPYVNSNLIERMLESAAKSHPRDSKSNAVANTTTIVASSYGETVGIPAIFPAIFFEDLRSLNGDKGAKSTILKSDGPILIEFPMGAVDIDTKQTMRDFESRL